MMFSMLDIDNGTLDLDMYASGQPHYLKKFHFFYLVPNNPENNYTPIFAF